MLTKTPAGAKIRTLSENGQINMYLGVAQLVARYLGVVEAAGSSPVTQTMLSVHNASELWTLSFSIYSTYLIFVCR